MDGHSAGGSEAPARRAPARHGSPFEQKRHFREFGFGVLSAAYDGELFEIESSYGEIGNRWYGRGRETVRIRWTVCAGDMRQVSKLVMRRFIRVVMAENCRPDS
jgi:hypothetical protein